MNESSSEQKMNWADFLPMIITWCCIVAQIILTFVLWSSYYDLDVLVYVGYVFWVLGAIFGIVPIIQFRRKGKVAKGDSYIKTTKLVRTGLYAIVRHPQYIAAIIISIALAFMSQHWVVIILVTPTIGMTFIDTQRADKRLIEKFGEEYENYRKEVPRMTPLYGILKLIGRKVRKEK